MTWGQLALSRLCALLAAAEGQHSLAVLDVDGLSAINADRGRAAGDTVLEDVERRLVTLCTGAEAERWVGDQFVVVLPFTAAAEASARLGVVLAASVGPTSYSLCAGGSTSPRSGTTNLELMAAAAAALRQAKRQGPGRVVWA